MTDHKGSSVSILPLLALVWIAGMVAGYYVGHKPFGGATAAALARAVLDLVAVGLMVTLGGAVGTGVFSLITRMGGEDELLSSLETLAISALVGLGALSLAVFTLVAFRLIPPPWVAWVLILGILAGLVRPALRWVRGLRDALRNVIPADAWGRFLALSVLVLLGMALVVALAPPTKWDALVYHLTAPAEYVRAGGFVSGADNHFFGFPQLVEMLYLWLILMRGPIGAAASPLHWAFGGLLVMLLLGVGKRLSGEARAGWVAAVVLLVSDSLWGEFAWPYVDLASAAYILAAFVVLSASPRAWLLGGILAGFALSTKYTLAGPAIGLGLLVLWRNRNESIGPTVGTAARFTIVALAILAPWLVKNTILDSNPIFPLVFPTAHFDGLDQQYYLRSGTGLPLWQLIVAPVHGTIIGREAGAPYGASAGALLVALLPTAFVVWRRHSKERRMFIRDALILSAPAYALWLAGNGISWFLVQTRLLFPIFPALALVAAIGLDGLRQVRQPLDVGWLARSLVTIVTALTLLGSVLSFVQSGAARVVLGLQSQDDYLASRLGWYFPAMGELNSLPEGSHVLFLWEPRTFYCEADCTPDSLLNRWWHDRQLQADPFAIASEWRAAGYTHVLIHEAGLRFLVEEEPFELMDSQDLTALNRLRDEVWVKVWEGGDAYTIYAWREDAPDAGD